MATFTASEINALKRNHAGINMVRSRIGIASGSLTTSDVVLMVRVPSGATVIDWWVNGGIGIDGGTGTWKLGVQGSHTDAISGNALSDDTLYAAMSLTTSGIFRAGVAFNYSVSATVTNSVAQATVNSARPGLMPFKISLSDGAMPQWVWLQLTNSSGSTTATCSLQMTVLYIVGQD
jgi:hypothetical protein